MLSSRWIKILAVLLMVVDHVGIFLFPETTELRIVGRLSYPLFAFIIAYGCIKTRNIGMYFLRLIACATMFEVILVLCDIQIKNIFFTLAFGVLCVWLAKFIFSKVDMQIRGDAGFAVFVAGAMILMICWVLGFLGINYGMAGVLLIVLFWVSFNVDKRAKKVGGGGGYSFYKKSSLRFWYLRCFWRCIT